MPTIRQMYAGTYNFYKTIYNGGKIYRQTANNKISQNNFIKNNEFDEKISALKNSAEKIKNLDLSDENALDSVKNFLNDYNGSKKFFKNNYESKIYENIGISRDFRGEMKMDEEKFKNAVKNNSKQVGRILENFAKKTDMNVMSASLQKNKNNFGGNFYNNGGNLLNLLNAGNFFNYMF